MNDDRMRDVPPPPLGRVRAKAHGRHGWMMVVCCIPMLAIAIALVAAGAVSSSFLLVAVACTAMMALMMRGMNHGGSDETDHAAHGGHNHPNHR